MLTSQNHDAIGESRIDKMRKFLSSPLSRKKQPSSNCKTFGTSLDILLQRSPSESSVPFILTRICQYIEKSGLQHEGLFRISGNARSIERLKIAFDRTGDAPLETEGDVPSAAALLKLFLRELPDPIIPLSMHGEFLSAVKEKNKDESLSLLVNLVQKLPSANYSILSYLSHFLKEVSKMEDQNRMSASSLGIVFGPNLFRVTEDFVGLKEQSLTNQMVTYFITDYDTIFKHVTNDFCHHDHRGSTLSMVSSWPKSKELTQSMLSTWSLQPLSVSIPPVDDSYLPLASLAYSIGTDPACTLLVPDEFKKVDVSSNNHIVESCTEQISAAGKKFPESEINFMKNKTENLGAVNHSEEESCTYNHSPHQSSRNSISSSEVSFTSESIEESLLKSQNDESMFDDSSKSSLDSGKSRLSSKLLSSEENSPTNRKLEDNHKSYHRTHRRHVYTHKKSHNAEDASKSARVHAMCTVEKDSKEGPITVENKHDGNANPLANSSHDSRYSWPVTQKLQEQEDITLSPLPQQLRIAMSMEAPLSPSAYRSHLSQRNIHLDPSLPPSPPVEQEDLVVGNAQDDSNETSKHLPKTIHGLKKKIKQFEENFQTLYGYRPSHAEKCSNTVMKKVMSDLHKAKQQLKQSKYQSSTWVPDDGADLSNAQSKISKGTNTRNCKSVTKPPFTEFDCTSNFEESVLNATDCLARQRKEVERPEALEEMSKEQLLAEKLAIQKILLSFESFHGRPSSKSHRELMRPLYDRYRSVKRLITRSAPNSSGKEAAELLPIIEHEAMDFASLKSDKNETKAEVENTEKPDPDKNGTSRIDTVSSEPQTLLNHNYHELSQSELLEEIRIAHDEKRQLRRVLREFEDFFKQEHGRKVQREDKRAMESEYTEYKTAKAKLKLLEALVTKHKQSSVE